jgi:hypothetical protein
MFEGEKINFYQNPPLIMRKGVFLNRVEACRNFFTSEPFRGNQSTNGSLIFFSTPQWIQVRLEKPLCILAQVIEFFTSQFSTSIFLYKKDGEIFQNLTRN